MDIKPDNILLQSENMRSLDSSIIYLIDFGISKRYLDRNGNHYEKRLDVPFSGNVLFASKYVFNNICKYQIPNVNLESSRRDDLISLAFLLCFSITGELNWLSKLKNSDPNFFLKVGRLKNKVGPDELCIGKAAPLKAFVLEIFKLEFADDP